MTIERPSGKSATIWVTPQTNGTVGLQTNLPDAAWRRIDGTSIADVGHGLTATDTYPPLGRYFWYQASSAGGTVLTSSPLKLTATFPRLYDIVTGANLNVMIRTQRPLTWQGRSVAFDVLQTEPVVVVAPPMPSAGSLLLRVAVTDLIHLHTLLKTGRVLALRSPCPTVVQDTTMLVKSWTLDNESAAAAASDHVAVKIDYQTVHEDIQAVQHLPEWSLQKVKEKYADLDHLRQSFPTLDALRIGPS